MSSNSSSVIFGDLDFTGLLFLLARAAFFCSLYKRLENNMPKRVSLATIKREFLEPDEADLTYVVLERSDSESVITRLHQHENKESQSNNRTVPNEWLNVFDEIEISD